MESKTERRYGGQIEIRKKDDGTESRTIRGYAALFNNETNIGGFVEEIAEGFFDDVLEDDVRALFNHNENLPLARTGAGLKLGVDKKGLWYEFEAPNTTAGNDLVENIRAGIIKESSFAWITQEEKWAEKTEKTPAKRTLLKAAALIDVSPVTYPAYPDTTVATRSLSHWSKNNESSYLLSVASYETHKRGREKTFFKR